VPVVLRLPSGSARLIAAQHSQSLEAWFMHVPGLQVVVPSTPYDAKGLMKNALRGKDPVIFIEYKRLYTMEGEVPEGDYTIPFGQADVKRQGNDVTIVASGPMVGKSLEAADMLAQSGIDVEVVDVRTLMPLDKQTIFASVEKTNRVIVTDEEAKRGGASAEIASLIAEECFDALDAPVKRVAAANVPMPFSPELEKLVVPRAEDLVAAVRQLLG
jgi:pyruvate dehydrogenase E1 component beta subunit